MSKILHTKVIIEGADFGANRHHVDLAQSPEPVTLADLFAPSFWVNRLHKLHEGDLVRVIGQNREFDLLLVVESKAPGGILLSPWPRPTPGSPEWHELLLAANSVTAMSKADLNAELSPSAPPAASKKKVAA